MTTGPIRSRFIHQAEPVLSMLQRNDSKFLFAVWHVWGADVRKNILPTPGGTCMVQ